MRMLFAPINRVLHPAVINEVSWGLNPAQTVVSSNSGTVFCQNRGTTILIPWGVFPHQYCGTPLLLAAVIQIFPAFTLPTIFKP